MIRTMGAVEALAARTDDQVSSQVVRQLSQRTPRQPSRAVHASQAARDYLDRSERIRQVQANREQALQQVRESSAQLSRDYPQLADEMTSTFARGLDYQLARAPNLTKYAIFDEPLLPDTYTATMDKVRAIALEDPVKALLGEKIHPESVRIVRDVYPQLHEKVAMRILEESQTIADSGEIVPFADIVNLSMVSGVPLESSMRPDRMHREQLLFAPVERPGPKPGNVKDMSGMFQRGLRPEDQEY
jgi:hypothetical protein